MKKLLLTWAVIGLSAIASAQNVGELFTKYKEVKGAQVVQLDKATLNKAMEADKEKGYILKEIAGIDVLNVDVNDAKEKEQKEQSKVLLKQVAEDIDKLGFSRDKLLIEVTEGKEKVRIYSYQDPASQLYETVVMSLEDDEVALVRLKTYKDFTTFAKTIAEKDPNTHIMQINGKDLFDYLKK